MTKRCIRDVDLPADPLQLARSIWDQTCPLLLWTQSGEGPSYVGCNPCQVGSGLDPEPELAFAPACEPQLRVPRWVGVLPYEAERARLERAAYGAREARTEPLITGALWWRYAAVAEIRADRVRLIGDDQAAVAELEQRLRTGPSSDLSVTVRLGGEHPEPAMHQRRIEDALQHIFAGDLYEVNLARRIDLHVEGTALALLARISQWARSEFAAALVLPSGAEVVSTSPELFLELQPDGHARTLPIKGTRPRGATADEDQRIARELEDDAKERAELAMVVDLERNDLGKVARVGSVRAAAPYVTTHTGIFHRQAEVSAVLRAGVGRAELLDAMLPSGSVTGAPKVRAMEIIAQLEAERRGLYTGAFGFIDHAGGMKLAMAIRTLSRRGALAHYFVGGGIVADSDPVSEVQETGWKALQVYNALSQT